MTVLRLVGVSHHSAPVELRERVAFDGRRSAEVARELAEPVGAEALASTLLEPAGAALYRLHDESAALHLFRVAAGLDSMVPGEGEILGQVRAAFEAGAPGPFLDRLFRQALHAGRRARAQTAIGESPASVSSAAAALAEQVFGELSGRAILLVGAGKVSELAARNLVAYADA